MEQDLGEWGVMFEPGAGRLLRTCPEGERQHVERGGLWSMEFWSLEVGP